jgi:hypothetical protein
VALLLSLERHLQILQPAAGQPGIDEQDADDQDAEHIHPSRSFSSHVSTVDGGSLSRGPLDLGSILGVELDGEKVSQRGEVTGISSEESVPRELCRCGDRRIRERKPRQPHLLSQAPRLLGDSAVERDSFEKGQQGKMILFLA